MTADVATADRPPTDSSATDPAGPWSSRWHRFTGVVLAGYLVFHLVQLAFLRRNPSMFDRLTELSTSVAARLVAVAVAVALVFHAGNGLRIVALEMTRASDRAATWSSNVVVFTTALSVLPITALILRPVLDTSWS